MIVTIDGPAGAGKSSAAKLLAQRLGFDYLDTGAMYRAVTLAGIRAGIDLTDQNMLMQLLENMRLELPAGKVLLNGEDVWGEIARRTSRLTRRRCLTVPSSASDWWPGSVPLPRAAAWFARDATRGRLFFRMALCKFFLSADPMERARRRHRELLARGETMALEEILEAQTARDRRDAARDIAPMVPAEDAFILDSTGMTLDEVVETMRREVERRRPSEH